MQVVYTRTNVQIIGRTHSTVKSVSLVHFASKKYDLCRARALQTQTNQNQRNFIRFTRKKIKKKEEEGKLIKESYF